MEPEPETHSSDHSDTEETTQVDVDAGTEDVSAPAKRAKKQTGEKASKPKAKRAPKPKPTYIVGFGDHQVDANARDFSRDAFEDWREQTLFLAQNVNFNDWKKLKRQFYREMKAAHATKRRKRPEAKEQTSENHLARLKDMPSEEFEELDGKWLSNYGFDGAFPADDLLESGCPNEGALPAFTVFQAAVHHGYRPLGIVSEKSKKNSETGDLVMTTQVEGDREYVGVALPFQQKRKSKFCVVAEDRVYNQAGPAGPAGPKEE